MPDQDVQDRDRDQETRETQQETQAVVKEWSTMMRALLHSMDRWSANLEKQPSVVDAVTQVRKELAHERRSDPADAIRTARQVREGGQ